MFSQNRPLRVDHWASESELIEEICGALGWHVDAEGVLRWEAGLGSVVHLTTDVEGSSVVCAVVRPDGDVARGRVRGTGSTGSNDNNGAAWGVVWVVAAVALDVLEAQLSCVVSLVEVVSEIVGLSPVLGRDAVIEAALVDATVTDGIDVVSNVRVAHAVGPLAFRVDLGLVEQVVHVVVTVATILIVGVGAESESQGTKELVHASTIRCN